MKFKALMVVAAVVLLSGCGSSRSTSKSVASTTISTPTTVAVPSTTTSTTAVPTGPVSCIAKNLQPHEVSSDAGAGNRYVILQLENTSFTCTMRGYPGMGIENATGTLVANVQRTAGPTPALTLKTGDSAYFTMHYTVVPTGNEDCVAVSRLDITPPDDTSSVPLAVDDIDTLCVGGGVSVTPMRSSTAQ